MRRDDIVVPPVAPTTPAIERALDGLTDIDAEHDAAVLDQVLQVLERVPSPRDCVPALLRVFERFPWSDGLGTVWGIVHALEAIGGYEAALVESVQRAPGEFSLVIINRILNSGVPDVTRAKLLSLLDLVASSQQLSSEARTVAFRLLDYQRGRQLG